jgi:hypothetical protein
VAGRLTSPFIVMAMISSLRSAGGSYPAENAAKSSPFSLPIYQTSRFDQLLRVGVRSAMRSLQPIKLLKYDATSERGLANGSHAGRYGRIQYRG